MLPNLTVSFPCFLKAEVCLLACLLSTTLTPRSERATNCFLQENGGNQWKTCLEKGIFVSLKIELCKRHWKSTFDTRTYKLACFRQHMAEHGKKAWPSSASKRQLLCLMIEVWFALDFCYFDFCNPCLQVYANEWIITEALRQHHKPKHRLHGQLVRSFWTWDGRHCLILQISPRLFAPLDNQLFAG